MQVIRFIPLALLLALAGCQRGATDAGAASKAPPVAVVNGQPISREFFDYYVDNAEKQARREFTPTQREQALDNLVRAHIVAQQAEKDGVDQQMETAALLELQRLNVLQAAVSQRYLEDKKPTPEELKEEYDRQVAQLPKQEYRARHILVATEDFAGKLIGRLEKGADFGELAGRESMDTSKQNGGDLGWFSPDRMVKPFSDAVMALKPGEFTRKPVQTQHGWHVIKLEETRPSSAPPFDEVKDRVKMFVQQKKLKAHLEELRNAAKVEKTGAAPTAAAAKTAEKESG
jgi:peptidyl-prolyl cis-trans isomerase C